MKQSIKGIIALGLLLALAVCFYSLADFNSRGGIDNPIYSTYRYDPYGTAGIYQLLRERGRKVMRLRKPGFTDGMHGTLVQVLSLDSADRDSRRYAVADEGLANEALLDWLAKGNTIVQFCRGQTALMSRFNLGAGGLVSGDEDSARGSGTDPDKEEEEAGESLLKAERKLRLEHEEYQRSGKHPSDQPGQRVMAHTLPDNKGGKYLLSLYQPNSFAINKAEDNIKGLARTGKKEWHICEVKFGEGRYIIVGAPSPVINGNLTVGDNLEYLLALLDDDMIIFDEWSHDVGQGTGIMQLIRQQGLWPVPLQVLFAVMLYAWASRGHHPQAHPEPLARRSQAEQIDTLGWLYAQTVPASEMSARISQEALMRLSRAMRVAPTDVESEAKRLSPKLKKKAEKLLRDTKKLQQMKDDTKEMERLAMNVLNDSESMEKEMS